MGFAIITVMLIAALLVANAILHIIQPFREEFNKATLPVFIWGLLLLVLACFWLKPPIYNWGNAVKRITGKRIIDLPMKLV